MILVSSYIDKWMEGKPRASGDDPRVLVNGLLAAE